MSNKELVIETVRELPDEATLDDIAEHIATLAAIRHAEEAADAGQWITHEELKRRVATWNMKAASFHDILSKIEPSATNS